MASFLHRDWAWLPRNLIFSILEKFDKFSDYVQFSGVCHQWRHYALDQATDGYKQRLRIFESCHNKLPMLMTDTNGNSEPTKRLLFSTPTREITYSVDLPLPYNRKFVGSAFGWLFAIERNMVITLLNPFTGGAVSLPPLKDPHDYYQHFVDYDDPENFIRKATLSSDPFVSPNSYEVLVIYGDMCRLAMFKYGQESWNFLDERYCSYCDVIYNHEGQIYGVDRLSNLVKIDFGTGTEIALTKHVSPISMDWADAVHLVESQEGDHLLLVKRYWNHPEGGNGKTSNFGVFKLLNDPSTVKTEEATLVPINRLGNQALFVGDRSLSVSTLEFPECLPNCIYYTQNYHIDFLADYVPEGVDDDSGMFNMEEESFQPCCIPDPHFGNKLWPLIWFVPNMKGAVVSCSQSSCTSEFGKIKTANWAKVQNNGPNRVFSSA